MMTMVPFGFLADELRGAFVNAASSGVVVSRSASSLVSWVESSSVGVTSVFVESGSLQVVVTVSVEVAGERVCSGVLDSG